MPPVRSKPDPEHWRHGAEVVPLAAAGLFAMVALTHAAGLSWWIIPAVIGTIVAAVVLATAAITGTPVPIVYAAATGTAGLAWSVYASITTPWSVQGVLSLLIPALFLGVLYPVIRGHHHHALAEAKRAAEAARLAAEARKWPDLLARVGAKGVTVIDSTKTRAGHTHRLRLPTTGKVTLAKLQNLADPLETAARLRDGAIRFELGDHKGEALMHVGENDILAQVIPYPDDLSDLTVTQPFGIGLLEDGTSLDVLYREVAVLIVGLRGAGKSNLINVLIAQLGRCVDTVIFMIDQKGGRAALPWLKPWMEGRTPRPVIDWVATNRDESERMLNSILASVNARAHSGAGGEKIKPAPAIPAIVLIIDEMAVIFGAHGGPRTSMDGATNTTLAGLGTQITQLGRSEAVDPIMATQRGTVTMTGGGDLKSQCGLRIGLGVATEADARLIIPDDASAARMLPRLKHPGSILVSDRDKLKLGKAYRLDYDRIDGIAEHLGHLRPEPDTATATALGDDYAARWTMERAGHIPGFARAARVGSRHDSGGTQPGADEFDRKFSEIVGQLGQEPEDERRHPGRLRMLDLLRAAGVRGLTPRAIVDALEGEQLGVKRQTVQRWLTEEKQAGRVRSASHGRWQAL